jgi:hypothetical protein
VPPTLNVTALQLVESQPPIGSSPNTLDDITALSLRFLQGEITAYPFSPAPLSSESQLILPHLLRLAKNGWWPVGSQPAVDGLQSDHAIVGWGPAGGYVYQKSFVEFFASEQVVERLEKAVEKAKGIVDFLAGNKMVRSQLAFSLWRLTGLWKGDLRSSVQASERNAVTWGVFPGQEIVQSTIIEEESFLTWKVRLVSPHHPSRVFIDVPAGRGVFDLDKLGISFRTRLTGARAAGGNSRYPLVGERHAPRL